jgi:hypothetical protein
VTACGPPAARVMMGSMRAVAVGLASLTLLLASIPAAAQADPLYAIVLPPPPPRAAGVAASSAAAPPMRWFGMYSLGIFGATSVLGVGAFTINEAGVGLTLLTTGVLLAGPLAHAAIEGPGPGFRALGLNLAAVLGGGITGGAATSLLGGCSGCFGGGDFLSGAIIGGAAGALVSLIVDVAALSYAPRSPARRGALIVPDLRVAAGGSTLGVAGAF